jgi:RNA polymerase sigma-70 factor (ECF subfamily)
MGAPGIFPDMVPANKASPNDQELVQRYLRGDAQAFDQLYDRHHRSVFLLVRQYFPQRERAEEVFQEIFMKVLDRLDRFQSEGSFKAWLFTVSRNHCIDRLRYQARRPETPASALGDPEEANHFLEQAAHVPGSQESRAYENQLAQQLQEALDKLPEEQRETFLLKESGGLTFEEIAQMMGVSVNTAKSRMRYALTHLRRVLRGKGFIKEAQA